MSNAKNSKMDGKLNPIYLIATPRSGSNLLRSILGSHPEVSALPPFEVSMPYSLPGVSPKLRKKFIRDILISQRYSPHKLQEEISPASVYENVQEWSYFELQRALYEECAKKTGATFWMTRFAGNRFSRVEETLEYYDDMTIIYLIRDARDVALSLKTARVGPYHPYFGALQWMVEQSIGRRVIENTDHDLHVVKYEELIQNPREVVSEICSVLGLEFSDEVFSYHQRKDVNEMADSLHMFENISKPIMSDNYGKFREGLTDSETAIVEKVAGPALSYFGYDLVTSKDELDNIELGETDEFGRQNESLERTFLRRKWKENPLEMLNVKLWENYREFLYCRYNVFHDR